jgi:hypothetical protein
MKSFEKKGALNRDVGQRVIRAIHILSKKINIANHRSSRPGKETHRIIFIL